MKGKQNGPAFKVTVSYKQAPDAIKRLHRVFQILLANSPKGKEEIAEKNLTKETPPTDGNNGGPTSGANGEDKNYGS